MRIDRIKEQDLGMRVLISSPTRVGRYPKGGFAMFMQMNFIKLAAVKYPGETLRVLLFYMGVVEYDNRIKYYTQNEISDIIHMARPNISKATKQLVTDGVIYKDGRDYYFNDDYVLKGVKAYKKFINPHTGEEEIFMEEE